MTEAQRFVSNYRTSMIFVLVVVGWSLMQPLLTRVEESRWWRDLTRQTPFRDVVITSVSATELEIQIQGTLVKDRECATFGPVIAQIVKNGIAQPAEFHTSEASNTPHSRPKMDIPQRFGPWIITSPIPWPDRAMVFRSHECSGELQTNMVLSVQWPKEQVK